jgi:hypothetical protein
VFKELKVLKLLVFFGVFFLLFFGKNVNNQQQLLFFCSEYSYSGQEPFTISFLSENKGVNTATVQIKDLNEELVFEKEIVALKHPDNGAESILLEGYSSHKSEVNLSLKPGFYSVNKMHPLIVKNTTESSQITVVVPLMNILLYQYVNGEKAVYGKYASISSLQNVLMDKNLLDARAHFKSWEEKYSINYITDYDLEHLDVLPQSELLIFAGNVPFWTKKMKTQFESYLERGGNALLITSYFQDNYAVFNEGKHQIMVRKDDQEEGYSAWQKQANELSSIISYVYGGIPTSVNYVGESGEIVKDVSIQSDLDMGIRDSSTILSFESGESVPIELNWLMKRSAKRHKIENESGAVEISLPDGQKIISLGSCDWLRLFNQNENSDAIGKITEVIDSLLK